MLATGLVLEVPTATESAPTGRFPQSGMRQRISNGRLTCPEKGRRHRLSWGERVFVTCYSGYGEASGGDDARLTRHLVCVDKPSGGILWTQGVKNNASEDRYQGFITEHGYASGTPVTDGENVYAFFGKSGVSAYDVHGNNLWTVNVGTGSSNRRWGSAASLILHGDAVIVNASEEARSVISLDKKTGKENWKTEADLLELAYGTPPAYQKRRS